jgi:hypothetical protein
MLLAYPFFLHASIYNLAEKSRRQPDEEKWIGSLRIFLIH